ncbi:8677_t:CDS:2, partial [Dentiscutata erythropus]
MTAAVIYQGLEDNPWISKNELRSIVRRAVDTVKNLTSDFERRRRINQIMPQPANRNFPRQRGGCLYCRPYSFLCRRHTLTKSHSCRQAFDISFDSIINLLEVGVIKTNKDKPLTSQQVSNNINKLRGKLSAKNKIS